MTIQRLPDRIPELDALRGLAAIGVLCLHTLYSYFFWAWSCVDLFFILSGFLITGILLDNADSPRMLVSFYVRRILRIWPVYYLSLLFTLAIFLTIGWLKTGSLPDIPNGQWLSFVFLQYTDHYIPGAKDLDYLWYFAHSWSLAVEEQFYLMWPLVLLLFRPGFRAMMLIVLTGILLTVLFRNAGAYFYLLATRMDGLLLGILLAYFVRSKQFSLFDMPLRYFVYFVAFGLLLVLPYMLSHGKLNLIGDSPRRALEVTGFSIIYMGIIAFSIRMTGTPLVSILRSKPLLHLGKLSFAIYMYQVPIAYLWLEAVEQEWITKPMAHFLTWPATLVAAQLSYTYIESNVLSLKRYFPYKASSQTTLKGKKAVDLETP